MEFIKENNKYNCTCEKCGSMLDYKEHDSYATNYGNTIDKGYRICPVCGSMIHELLGIGKLQR